MKENNVKAGKKGGRYIKNFIYEYSFILVLLVIDNL